MEESLMKNEIWNIKKTTLWGYDTGPFLKDDDLNDWEELIQEEILLDNKF